LTLLRTVLSHLPVADPGDARPAKRRRAVRRRALQEVNEPMAIPTVFRRGYSLPTAGGDSFWNLSRTFDRLFDDVYERAPAPTAFAPRLEVVERQNEFLVSAELPGLEEKDFALEVHGNVLTLRGEKRSERGGEGEVSVWTERSYGAFRRAVELPTEVAADRATAAFRNGVLTVTVPKSDAAKVRHIPVNAA
jgi:HSP20 family protein